MRKLGLCWFPLTLLIFNWIPPINPASLCSVCSMGSDCLVDSSSWHTIDCSISLRSLTVHGILDWDTTKAGLELRTGGVLVERGGTFKIGERTKPMELEAKIYIEDNGLEHPYVGNRYLATYGEGHISLNGRALGRTWTLLAETVSPGSTQLRLKHEPTEMGWRVGDRVGVATTTRSNSTLHTIVAIIGDSLEVEPPMMFEHWGGVRTIEGFSFEMAAEVVNLERSITITGDHQDFQQTGQGWHGGAFLDTKAALDKESKAAGLIKASNSTYSGEVCEFAPAGSIEVNYVRMEHCGQLDVLGRYCMHFHLIHHCPECILQGNAFLHSFQSAISVHGTHSTTVDNNVLWDSKGVGIYMEDGNEMNNTLSNNVIICPVMHNTQTSCKIEWQQEAGPGEKSGGLFLFGMSNDILHNRVIGHEHGLWSLGSGQPDGRPMGMSMGMVCNQFMPYGKIQGNVFHDNKKFGFYMDNQFPRQVETNCDGMASNERWGPKPTCGMFKHSGEDNGVVCRIEDQFDWHNEFVGGYFAGDISWVRYTSVNNDHPIYWKWSKNFVDGKSAHIQDSLIVNDRNDHVKGILRLLLPGGPFAFRMRNVTIAGGPVGAQAPLSAPHHCGMVGQNDGVPGSMCTGQILLEDVDTSGIVRSPGEPEHLVTFLGPAQGNPLAPIFLARDSSLDGLSSIVSPLLNGFGLVPGCSGPHEKWDGGWACGQEVVVRRLTIWAPDMGDLQLIGPGYLVEPDWSDPVLGSNGGVLHWDGERRQPFPTRWEGGYAAPVVLGQAYVLEGLKWTGEESDIIIEVSDPELAEVWGQPREEEAIELKLRTAEGKEATCRPHSGESRKFHSTFGIADGSPLGRCGLAFRQIHSDLPDYTLHPTTSTITTEPAPGSCDCGSAEWDWRCHDPSTDPLGGLGCMGCGVQECRVCGGDPYPPCTGTSDNDKTTSFTDPTTSETEPTKSTEVPDGDCSACAGSEWSSPCLEPGTDTWGGWGCKACGIDGCRFCDPLGEDWPPCQKNL